MAIRPGLLVITLLFLPVMALGQSYEWSDRPRCRRLARPTGRSGQLASASMRSALLTAVFWSSARECCRSFVPRTASCSGAAGCPSDPSPTYSVAVNDLGVFVVGNYRDSNSGSFVRRYSHDGDIVWTVRDCCIDRGARAIDSDADGCTSVGINGLEEAVLRHLSSLARYCGRASCRSTPTAQSRWSSVMARSSSV